VSTTAIATTTATGLGALPNALVATDRGCFPIAGSAQNQGIAAMLTVAAATGSAASAQALTDTTAYVIGLCYTYGTCCYTNLCNSGDKRVDFNVFFLILSALLAKVFQ